MNNTKRAVRAFYLEPRRFNGLLAAKLTFPFFYRKFLKWLGEIPGEPDTDRLNTFLKVSGHTAEDITLVIPLKERYLIFWWGSGDGEIDNEVILCPKSMVKDGLIDPEAINDDIISNNLYTKGQPDPDFILRPSGEKRISNFLLWQIAYSEFVYMDVLWPDFTRKDLDDAIIEFNRRNRRFGGV